MAWIYMIGRNETLEMVIQMRYVFLLLTGLRVDERGSGLISCVDQASNPSRMY